MVNQEPKVNEELKVKEDNLEPLVDLENVESQED